LLHILYGEDDFSLSEALREMKEGWGDAESLATNTTTLDAGDTTPEQLAAICDTMPFLAPKRLVIVKGLLGRHEQKDTGKSPRKADQSQWTAFAEYVKRMPDSTELVLIDGPLKKNSLLPKLAPGADVQEFKVPKGQELTQWIGERARQSECDIAPAAARLLAGLVGNDLRIVANEIDKLCLYARNEVISEDDVRQVVAEAREANVFAMVDAILARRAGDAIRLLHELEAGGAAPPYLLYMITRQFRMLVLAKDLMGRRAPDAQIMRAIETNKDFVLRKSKEQARKHTTERLESVYGKLLETDLSIKTGRLRGDKGEMALDLLVADLCA
jgi:DNA polymerase-3 subunit delta